MENRSLKLIIKIRLKSNRKFYMNTKFVTGYTVLHDIVYYALLYIFIK